MTPLSIVSICFGVVGTIFSILFGVIAFRRNNKSDDTENGKQMGAILSDMNYIKNGIDDIKRKQDKQDEQYVSVIERLSTVEQSAKQAHHRIDAIETKIKG